MSSQSIYTTSGLRRISYDPAAEADTFYEMDSTGTVKVTMDLTQEYIRRTAALMKQLLEATTEEQKGAVVARLNVIRQELAYLTGVAFTTVQLSATTGTGNQ